MGWWLWFSRRGMARTVTVEEEFRVLDFIKKREKIQRPQRYTKEPLPPPRTTTMPTDQHWPSVWTGPRTFHPASVPLPLRQGYPLRNSVPPAAYANTELMKIPNFLHLTPPAIKEQCEVLKKFCTKWPEGLETEEKCLKHFPLEIITSDYCHSGPSIRNNLSRIVSVRIKLSQLTLNNRAKDKFLRLVGNRYDESTDYVTIVADRCPVRKQNLDYALYLLTAVYHESWNVEAWESEKSEEDMEVYIWENNKSRKVAIRWFTWDKDKQLSDEEIKNFDISVIPGIEEYRKAVLDIMNVGDSDETYDAYKKASLKLLNLSAPVFKTTFNLKE